MVVCANISRKSYAFPFPPFFFLLFFSFAQDFLKHQHIAPSVCGSAFSSSIVLRLSFIFWWLTTFLQCLTTSPFPSPPPLSPFWWQEYLCGNSTPLVTLPIVSSRIITHRRLYDHLALLKDCTNITFLCFLFCKIHQFVFKVSCKGGSGGLVIALFRMF